MRPDFAVVLFTLITSTVASAIDGPLHVKRIEAEPSTDESELYKRRGGGGGGGRGGSSGGGGKSSGGGSSRGGSGSSGSGRSGSGSSGSSSRPGSSGSSGSRGGSSGSSSGSRGVGPQPSYGGGRYYAGGSATPYRAGGRSPVGRVAPFVLLGAGLAFWPGVWLYGAYMYPYSHPYRFHNETSDEDEERDVICACARYAQCACDDNNNTAYYDELIGNGSYQALNKSVVDVAKVNGTMTILINGTLPNDTALPSDDSSSDDSSDSAAARTLIEALGFWPAVAVVMATVFIA
ncbi:Ff.00g022960.m01.CDS01 [Fusarium sp. VM40]|nr:Ff.00g022960.m01.CDS01 [Fusarium sp. VM40]